MNTGHIKAIITFVAIALGPILGHFGLVAASVPTYLALVLAAGIAVLGWWIFRKAANTKGWVPVISVAGLTAAAVAVALIFGGSLQFAPILLIDTALVVVALVLGWWIKRSDTRALNFRHVLASDYKLSYNPAAGGTDGTN